MKPTIELLIKALQTCAKAHNIEFRDFSKDPDEVPQVLLKSESVPINADVRFICQAFFGSSSMIEVGYGYTTVFLTEAPFLPEVNEQTLALALPAGTELYGQLRNEVRNEDCGQPALTQQGRPVPGSLPGKDVLMGIARAVRDALSGREIEFGPQADLFLKQFGIRRLTELRDSYKVEEEEDPQKLTALDEAMGRSNFAGVNNTAVQDFVIEKNGIQMYIFIEYGIWYVGNFVLFPGDSFPQCIA